MGSQESVRLAENAVIKLNMTFQQSFLKHLTEN
jgi:hypothetical protein